MKKKLIILVIGVLLFNIILLAGCSELELYSSLKSEPGVLDLALIINDDNSICCEIILKEDVSIKDNVEFARNKLDILKKEFKNRDILIVITQNEEIITRYSYKQ